MPSQSLTVPEYSRQFFERVVKGSYGETLEENWKVAGENFVCAFTPNQPHFPRDKVARGAFTLLEEEFHTPDMFSRLRTM